MRDVFLSWSQSIIHYSVGGSGDRLLFCFHGYGENAATFSFLEKAIGHLFTIVAIDMPFHGQTDWKEGNYFAPDALVGMLEAIQEALQSGDAPSTHLESDNQPLQRPDEPTLCGKPGPHQSGDAPSVHSEPDNRSPGEPTAHGSPGQPTPQGKPCRLQSGWWLMGYSMGGRVALQLVELVPGKIRGLVLLAPDGLTVHPLYWLATQTGIGNRLFRRVMNKPGGLFSILRAANALRLVNPSIYKFTQHYINDNQVRQELYVRWTTMRGFRPHLHHIQAIIRERQLPVFLLYGQYDRIILSKTGLRFQKGGIADYCRLQVLPTGHQLLHPRYTAVLLSIFTDLLN